MSGNDLFSAILMTTIILGIGWFVTAPLLRVRPEDILHDDYADTPLHHLLSKKDSIYTAMKDLEFDYTTGKLSDNDYRDLHDKFALEAAGVLQELDELGGKKAAKRSAGNVMTADKEVCQACGFKVEPDDNFCQSCGSKIA